MGGHVEVAQMLLDRGASAPSTLVNNQDALYCCLASLKSPRERREELTLGRSLNNFAPCTGRQNDLAEPRAVLARMCSRSKRCRCWMTTRVCKSA